MILRWAGRATSTMLALAILVNVGLLVRTRLVARAHHTVDTDGLFRQRGAVKPFSALEGYAPSGEHRTSTAPKGWAIRYSSRTCKFCEEDTVWVDLERSLEKAGVKVNTILPRAEPELAAEDSESQAAELAFLPMEFIGRVRITLAPTVLIFDGRGELIWYQQGALRDAHFKTALNAVQESIGG